MCDGKMVFVLFGADGTPALVADNVDAVVQTAIEQGLGFVAVYPSAEDPGSGPLTGQ